MTSLSKLVDINEIAESLNISVKNVKRLTRKHDIPYYRVCNKWRFATESYELLLEKLECRSTISREKSIGMSKVRFGMGMTTSPFEKVQELVAEEMQKRSAKK